jgi:hypothetical protein
MTNIKARLPIPLFFANIQTVILLLLSRCRWLFGPTSITGMTGDTHIYFIYATKCIKGLIPYRDYLVEYPIFAFPLFLIPRLIVPDFRRFVLAFTLELALFNAVAVCLVASWIWRHGETDRVIARLTWYTSFLICLCPLAAYRYDLAPMAISFASCCAWFGAKPGVGAGLAALGTLMKVFPCVVVVPASVRDLGGVRSKRYYSISAFILSLAICIMLWCIISRSGVTHSIGYHLERGVEIESIYAGLFLAFARLTGTETSTTYNHGCIEIVGSPWVHAMGRAAIIVQGGALLIVGVRSWRSIFLKTPTFTNTAGPGPAGPGAPHGWAFISHWPGCFLGQNTICGG